MLKFNDLKVRTSKIIAKEIEISKTSELKGVEKSEFGTVYRQFKDKPKEAIKHLLKVKEGN